MTQIDEEVVVHRMISATGRLLVRERYALFSRFQCGCLKLLDPPLAAPLASELLLAERHWFGDQSCAKEFIAANERCWGYLAECALAHSPVEDEYRARLVIGLLIPEVKSRDEVIEGLEWFLEYLNLIGDYSAIIEALVREIEESLAHGQES